jgi:hypothetical protein
MAERYTVHLYHHGTIAAGTLEYDELGHEECSVAVTLDGECFVGLGGDYFDALIEVRKKLESRGYLVDLYGATRNVWPSAMSRSMGGGLKAYRLHIGRHATLADLVDIFSSGPDSEPCSVAEQEAFMKAWFSSLSEGDRKRR